MKTVFSKPFRLGSRVHRTIARSAGFTLVEMLVVLAIMGLLIGLVAPRVLGQLSNAKVKTAHIQIENFKNALDVYFLDIGRYPSTSEGLTALVSRPIGASTWNGPYIKGSEAPRDPWNNPYVYRSPGENGRAYDIISNGPDGQEASNTASLITSW